MSRNQAVCWEVTQLSGCVVDTAADGSTLQDSVEGWVPSRLDQSRGNAKTLLLPHWMNTSPCWRSTFTTSLVEVWKFRLGLAVRIPNDWPWESASKWIKMRKPRARTKAGLCSRQFGYNYPSWTWPWGAVITFSWLRLVTDDDWFQGQLLYIVSNCSWWQKSSALLCRNQSHGLKDISLDECTSWSLLRVRRWAAWVTSPAQWASCGSSLLGALQLVSTSTTWFLAEWTDSCWQTRRQVVCTFLDKAQGNQT